MAELRAAFAAPVLLWGDERPAEWALEPHIFERGSASGTSPLIPCDRFATGETSKDENRQWFLAHATIMRIRLLNRFSWRVDNQESGTQRVIYRLFFDFDFTGAFAFFSVFAFWLGVFLALFAAPVRFEIDGWSSS